MRKGCIMRRMYKTFLVRCFAFVCGMCVLLFSHALLHVGTMQAMDSVEAEVPQVSDESGGIVPDEQSAHTENAGAPEIPHEQSVETTPVEQPATPSEEQEPPKSSTEEVAAPAGDEGEVPEQAVPGKAPEPTIDAPKTDASIPVHEIPAAPAEEKAEIPEHEPETEEVIGIDTADLEEPRGNWLFKRIWWERSEQQYDKIRAMVEKINDLRMQFFARRTELDKTIFDPFFVDIGFSQGELAGTLALLLERIEQDRKKEGSLDEHERELLDVIVKDRAMVEQLHRDAQGIAALENSADELIQQVMEQKSQVSRYEREAWDNMREIARILSDTKARELYYQVDAAWRNIKNIHRYIEQDLQRSFDQLIANAKQQTERIKGAMQTLKEKGIDLKSNIEKMNNEAELTGEAQEEMPTEAVKPQPKKGIVAKVTSMLSGALSSIINVIMWVPRKLWMLIKSFF
jgi:hypothetical protein